MALSAATFVGLTDHFTSMYLANKGDGTVALNGLVLGAGDPTLTVPGGIGTDWGTDRYAYQCLLDLYATGDTVLIQQLQGPLFQMQAYTGWKNFILNAIALGMRGLKESCRQAGAGGLANVKDIDTFATYYNIGAGGPFTALLAPDFSTIHNTLYGVNPTAKNVYSPAIATMATQVVGSAFAPGTSVNTTLYAGFTKLNLIISSFSTSTTGSVSIAVSGWNAAGNTATDTFTVTGVNANGTFAVPFGTTVKCVTSVTAITPPGSFVTGVSCVVAGVVPTGRTNPPT